MTPGEPSDGRPRPPAPEQPPRPPQGRTRPSPARPANPHRSSPTCTQVDGCGQPARLYPSGWACDNHCPHTRLLRRDPGTALDELVRDGEWDTAFALKYGDQQRPIETVHLPEDSSP